MSHKGKRVSSKRFKEIVNDVDGDSREWRLRQCRAGTTLHLDGRAGQDNDKKNV